MRIKIHAAVLLMGLALSSIPDRTVAQSFTSLYSFTNGADGSAPQGGLVINANTIYGTASSGGGSNYGTAFAIGANGEGFVSLHTFSLSATNTGAGFYTNSNDGTDPESIFVLSGNTLYGTAYGGGTNGMGTLFALNTDGSGFTTLHYFSLMATNSAGVYTNGDGVNPASELVLSGSRLFGTTEYGGTNGTGTIFEVNTDGSGFAVLHTFGLTATNSLGVNTNGDGANPSAGLVLSGNTLFGTAEYGGTNGSGTVFALATDGSSFTTLYQFSAMGSNSMSVGTYTNNVYTNGDGTYPAGGLAVCSNMLYGTAQYGGTNGTGTIFALSTNGTSFAVLHYFQPEIYSGQKLTNGDGAHPQATLAMRGGKLFGTAYAGGANDCGTVYSVNTDGSGFQTLHTFGGLVYSGYAPSSSPDGAFPYGGVTLWSSNMLVGTTSSGGTSGAGTVFVMVYGPGSIPLFGQLNQPNLNLSWYDSNFTLQSAPAVTGPWTTVISNTNALSVPASGGAQFYRLINITGGP